MDRAKLKSRLITEACLLKDRITALKKLRDEKIAQLRSLMAEDGDGEQVNDDGVAKFYSHPVLSIKNLQALARLPQEVILQAVKPSKTWYDAARKAGYPVAESVTMGRDERFKVERRKSAEARYRQKQIIEATQKDAKRRLTKMAKSMQGNFDFGEES